MEINNSTSVNSRLISGQVSVQGNRIQPSFLASIRSLAIKAEAKNLSQLFWELALELSAIISPEKQTKSAISRIVECKAVDENSLLYEWLAILIKIADEENLVVQKCEFEEMSYTRLVVKVWFAKFDNSYIPTSVSQDINIKNKKKLFSVKVELDY